MPDATIQGTPVNSGYAYGRGQRLTSGRAARTDIVLVRSPRISQVELLADAPPLAVVVSGVGLLSHTVSALASIDSPVVVVPDEAFGKILASVYLEVDGQTGRIRTSDEPMPDTRPREAPSDVLPHLGPLIRSQSSIEFLASVGSWAGVKLAQATGLPIGLVRTEMLVPSEIWDSAESQYKLYSELTAGASGSVTTIRMFDLDAEKAPGHLGVRELLTRNYGLRGIRQSEIKEIRNAQTCQLEAISALDPGVARVLVPFVSSGHEIDNVRQFLAGFNSKIQVGAMLETPSSLFSAKDWASACDFLAIGTSDLLQWWFGVARASDITDGYIRVDDEGLVLAFELAMNAASRHRIPIQVCGRLPLMDGWSTRLMDLGYSRLCLEPIAICSLFPRLQPHSDR